MSTTIHETAVVDPKAELGTGVEIGPYSVVGPDVELHDRVKLHAHVSLAGWTQIGEGTEIYPFSALGHPPQDLKYGGGKTTLVVGKNNIMREHVTMHAGTELGRGETWVGADGFFMVGTHVAHDCYIGDGVTCANQTTIGGHVHIDEKVIMGRHVRGPSALPNRTALLCWWRGGCDGRRHSLRHGGQARSACRTQFGWAETARI